MAIPMKTHLIRFKTQSIKNLRGLLAGLITTLIFFNLLPKAWSVDLFWEDFAATPATAGAGTWATGTFTGVGVWSSTPTSSTPTPWVDGSVAHFLGSGGGIVTLGSNITAAGINFDPGANPFTINTNGNTLTITGAGIVNTSGQTQTIINEIPAGFGTGSTFFFGASSAGGVTIINNGDSTEFHDISSAGSATITNIGGTMGGSGGFTEFFNTSTAGNATIITNGGTVAGSGGSTFFFDSAD